MQFKNAENHDVHQLLPKIIIQRRLCCETLYKNYLVENKMEMHSHQFVVLLVTNCSL